MATDKPTVSMADLMRLSEQADQSPPLKLEGVHDYAVASMVVLRGLSRSDKLRVIRRMRRLMG